MSTPSALAQRGTVVQGSVIEPSAVVDAKSEALHGLVNVVKRLVTNSGAFHNEADVDAALDSLEKYARVLMAPSVRNTLLEESPTSAPHEDVTLRQAPTGATPMPLLPGLGPIDYDKLARAMVAAQQAVASQAVATNSATPPEPTV